MHTAIFAATTSLLLAAGFASSEEQKVQNFTAKCVPTFSLVQLVNSTQNGQRLSSGVTLPVGNIDLNVGPSESSLGSSAMRLLTSIGSQFVGSENAYGDGGIAADLDAEENQDEYVDEAAVPSNVVRFRDNQLHVNGLNLSMLNVHVFGSGEPRFGFGVTIKNTTLTGRFSYNGPLLLTDSRLAGYYRMSIDNIYLIVGSNLTKSILTQRRVKSVHEVDSDDNEKGAVGEEAEDVDDDDAKVLRKTTYMLKTNGFGMNITNLGYISIDIFDSRDLGAPTTNYLLRMLQRVLQRTIKRTYYTFETYIRSTLERESRRSIDCELSRFSPLLTEISHTRPPAHTYIDQADLGRILTSELARTHFSQVSLPDFEHTQSVLGTSATVHFRNGSLTGLDNLALSGETRVKLQDEHLFVNTSIGWRDLRPYYNWSLRFGQPAVQVRQDNNNSSATDASGSVRGFVSFHIKQVDFDAVITRGLRRQSTETHEPHTTRPLVVVEQLTIRHLDGPRMDIGGLPGMNRVTRVMVNFFMGRLKQRLSSAIQPVLRQQLERSLNKLATATNKSTRD